MRTSSLLFALVTLLSTGALASDTWTEPHPGIRQLHRTTSTPWQIHALAIDLCEDGVSARATRSSERQQRTSNFASAVGAHAAVNGDFFSYDDYSTSGLAIGDGEPWPGTGDGSGHGFVAFGLDRAELSPPAEVRGPEGWMTEAVGGNVHLVSGGVAMSEDSGSFCTTRHPRTASGFSEDGRTLLLVVVDGRSSASAGMRCSELASLMADLGAWEALNLDGGGSTTMVVAGEGVVNDPSDGNERTVANHLGIVASGLLERPMSCDRSLDAAARLAAVGGVGATTTDVDGDGIADLCGRGPDGFTCSLQPDGFEVESPGLSDATGWSDVSNWATLRMGDIDGDGRADVCARANAAFYCWPSLGESFGALIGGIAWSDEAGWDRPEYFGTIRLADVNGDGLDDVCGRSPDGFECWLSDGAGFPTEIGMDELSDALGWARPQYYGSIRMGDVDGDGLADVCARMAVGMGCWRSLGDGFEGTPIAGPAWSDEAGWDALDRWSTIRLLDLDGDGRADLCGRGPDGIACHLSEGDGFGPALAGPAWGDGGGWTDFANASTVRYGDLDGDGRQDVCARADAGVTCARFDGVGFGASFAGPELADDGAWDLVRFHSTMRLADVTGDGRADLCARGWNGMLCWESDGAGFAAEPSVGPAWGEPTWREPSSYGTIRLQSPAAEVVDEGDDDDDTVDGGDPDDDEGDDDDADGSALEVPDLADGDPGAGLGCGGCAGGDDGGATFALLLLVLGGGVGTRLRRDARAP